MSEIGKKITEGTVLVLLGLPLWLFAGGVETPVITLTKTGLVLAVIGALTLLHGGWLAMRSPKSAGRP